MIERAPRLELSADGRIALIDDRQGHLQLFALPAGAPVFALDADPFVYITCQSNSGTAVATLSEKRVVEIAGIGAPARLFELPESAGQVRQMQVADDGRSLLLLAEVEGDWRLERWSLPFSDAPEASRTIARPKRPRLVANGALDRLAYWDDRKRGRARLYAFVPEDGFDLLWKKKIRPVEARLSRYWSWFVLESGLRGWGRDGRRARFPGSLRDRLIFTSQGHLLVYGGVVSDAPLAPNETLMRFRLLDLENEREIGRLDRPVESSSAVRFMVSEDLALYAVRAGHEGDLLVASLGAFGDSA
jgi:hypothetical protein